MGAPLWELLGISHPVFESTFYYSEVATVCHCLCVDAVILSLL